jgi:hypothetical protein
VNKPELLLVKSRGGTAGVLQFVIDGFKDGSIKAVDLDFHMLAEALVGEQWASPEMGSLVENSEASDAFRSVVAQFWFAEANRGFKEGLGIGDQLAETVSTALSGERIPQLTEDKTGADERYVDTPQTEKWGFTVSLTKEPVFLNRPKQFLRNGFETGFKLGYNKLNRILACVLGLTKTFSCNGSTYDTYSPSLDRSDIPSNCERLSLNQHDSLATAVGLCKRNGAEIKNLLVLPARLFHAKRLLSIESSNHKELEQTEVLCSPIAYQLLTNKREVYAPKFQPISPEQANGLWFAGDFQKAFAYMENWPLTCIQAPREDPDANPKDQDILLRLKASERGVPAVFNPECVWKFQGD